MFEILHLIPTLVSSIGIAGILLSVILWLLSTL